MTTKNEALKRDGERLKDLKTDASVRGGTAKRPDALKRPPIQPCI